MSEDDNLYLPVVPPPKNIDLYLGRLVWCLLQNGYSVSVAHSPSRTHKPSIGKILIRAERRGSETCLHKTVAEIESGRSPLRNAEHDYEQMTYHFNWRGS